MEYWRSNRVSEGRRRVPQNVPGTFYFPADFKELRVGLNPGVRYLRVTSNSTRIPLFACGETTEAVTLVMLPSRLVVI